MHGQQQRLQSRTAERVRLCFAFRSLFRTLKSVAGIPRTFGKTRLLRVCSSEHARSVIAASLSAQNGRVTYHFLTVTVQYFQISLLGSDRLIDFFSLST